MRESAQHRPWGFRKLSVPADEGKAWSEFAQGLHHAAHEVLFKIAFGDFAREAEEFKVVGVLGDLLGQFGIGCDEPLCKV
jgi:hypothetical protein